MSKSILSNASIALIAMACHSVNAAYCQSLGDDSQVAWDQASDAQKASIGAGVEFRLANPSAPASAQHDNWLKSKEADGWKYGDVKDEDAKTHPCFKPFAELPPEQQFKDLLFATVVSQLVPVLAENEKLASEVSDLSKKVEGAAAAPKASKGAKPAKARKIGPVDDQPASTDLLELIGAAETVEVAFSNGKTEIAELAPLVIAGDAWTVSLDRVKLNVPGDLLVHGPGGGKPAYAVAGYGLLLDGELVAYQARGDTLQIGANAQVNLKDDIIF